MKRRGMPSRGRLPERRGRELRGQPFESQGSARRHVDMPVVISGRRSSVQQGIGSDPDFIVEEADIAAIHAAMKANRLTALQLVEHYLARIEAYDQQGPAVNAIITVHPQAEERAGELDADFARSGRLTGALHGIPVIVKDNYDTADLPTSAGSLALAHSIPPDDAFQIQKIRAAGAIVLAKANMAELAISPYETVSSALPGYTKNPYALDRVTAGSSGGTPAAIAANFGAVGLGTDTGNSIRGPASHTLLVGIRPTMGLTSRDGIVPHYLDHDVGGPMTRTLADGVAVLDVIAGYDPADPVTAESLDRKVRRYADHLNADSLRGTRLGVVRQLADAETGDLEIRERFAQALDTLRACRAEIFHVRIEELETTPRDRYWCRRFRYDLDNLLASLGPSAAVRSLEEIIDSNKFHPSIALDLRFFYQFDGPPEQDERCRHAWNNGKLLAAGIRRVLEASKLDALVYPTWSNPPRRIGDLNTPAGDNSQELSPHTGFPAITVPMGLVGQGLPVGLQILGQAWAEPRLIEIAYTYEQATQHRRPPPTTPPLRSSS